MTWSRRPGPSAGPGRGSGRYPWLGRLLLLSALLACAACAARKDYNRAAEDDTIEAYERFLGKHPGKKDYSARARSRLEELSFRKAAERESFAVYAAFVQRFPYGKFAKAAELRAEDLHARELGLNFYRQLPEDYARQVSPRELPYRILVKSSEPEGANSEHLERNWYEELVRRDLLVPMNPRQAYTVRSDLTLYLRESVIRLCRNPLKQIEAEVWAGNSRVKDYRLVADRADKFLLYEIFRDRELYDARLGIPAEEKKKTEERFLRLRRRLPLPGALALEYELRLGGEGNDRDQQLTLAYASFLKDLKLFRDLVVYPRGQPPARPYPYRLFFRVDPDTHSPSVRLHWDRPDPAYIWTSWNSKWVLQDQEYFFRRMTLDLLDRFPPPPPVRKIAR